MSDTISEVLKIFTNNWNKQVILYGPPGTSKTYSATIIAAAMLCGSNLNSMSPSYYIDSNKLLSEDALLKKLKDILKGKQQTNQTEIDDYDLYKASSEFLKTRNNYKLVQFHPSYSYEDFVRGIKVKPTNGGTGVTYEVESKIIEKFCERKGRKVLVIDEINRAPLASVLGELIYGLEYRGEKISTPYEIAGKELSIPDDLYIIGTMNTADRSIGSMDYAVRRRFAFVPVGSVDSAIEASWKDNDAGKKALALYNALVGNDKEENGIFNEKYLEDKELDVEDIKIGHTYFLGKEGKEDEDGIEYLEYRLNYQIKPIYMEYIKDGIIKKAGMEKLEEYSKAILNNV